MDRSRRTTARWCLLALLASAACMHERIAKPGPPPPLPSLDHDAAVAVRAARFTGVVPTVLVRDALSGAERRGVPDTFLASLGETAARSLRPSAATQFDQQSGLLFLVYPAGGKTTRYANSVVPWGMTWSCVIDGVDLGLMAATVSDVRHAAVAGTGGHGTGSHPQKPHGASVPKSGATGGDRVFRTTYSATEISGDETLEIDWTLTDGAPECIGQTGTFAFVHATRWAGLSHLTAGNGVSFAPISSNHTDIYYGTAEVERNMHRAGLAYQRNIGIVLPVTAASLVYGGLNDVGNNWHPPHTLHRTGEDIDFDGRNNTPAEHKIIMAIGMAEGFRKCEVHNGNHVHCYTGAVYK